MFKRLKKHYGVAMVKDLASCAVYGVLNSQSDQTKIYFAASLVSTTH